MIPTLAAEPIFYIGVFPVTNSIINTVIVSLGLIAGAFVIKKQVRLVPRGMQNATEATVEFMLGYIRQVTGDEKRARKFLPFIGTLFLFILFSNWLGIFPGIGTIGVWQIHGGHEVLVPLFRPATSDINTTLALAVLGIGATHLLGIAAIGFWKHIGRFIQLGQLKRAFTKPADSIFERLLHIVVAIVEIGVGFIETIGEVAKVISLSLRLYGNVFAGEVLLTVMASLFAFFLPVPFLFLELIVGIIQATVFAMLTLVFLTVMTDEPQHE